MIEVTSDVTVRTVKAKVTGEDYVHRRGEQMRPMVIEAAFTGAGVSVRVAGVRMKRDGSPGRTPMAASWGERDLDSAPQWVRDFVAAVS